MMSILAQLARDRVRHSTKLELDQARDENGEIHKDRISPVVGMEGALVYALLDVAEAIRQPKEDPKQATILQVMDSLVTAITEGEGPERIKELTDLYYVEQHGFNVDQKSGIGIVDDLRKGME